MQGANDTDSRQFRWTSTAAALGLATTGYDCRFARSISFTVTGLTGETIGLLVSHDGGATWSAALRPYIATTGALAAASTLGNGTYYMDIAAERYKFTKSSTSETAVISGTLRS